MAEKEEPKPIAKKPLTEKEFSEGGYHLEDYARGFIVAHYTSDARYCGVGFAWTRQPIIPPTSVFASKDAAVAALNVELAAGRIELNKEE